MSTTTIHSIQMPARYYEERRTVGGGTVRDGMPYEDAVEYVTDGEQYGVRYEDGQVDWLGTSIWIQGDDEPEEVAVSTYLTRS